MKKIVSLSLISLIILSGCGTPPVVEVAPKQPFYVSTIDAQSLTQRPELLKSGKIVAGQEIVISSQVAGRVEEIATTLGANVTTEQLLIRLKDTNGAYTFGAQRAGTSLEQARIAYTAAVQNTDKSLTDSQLALRQAETQWNSASTDSPNSSTQLQLDQVDAELQKATFDFNTKLEADQQTLNNFVATAGTLTEDIRLLRENVLTETDKILGITDLYKYTNDAYEAVLGARNTATYRAAKDAFRMVNQQDGLRNLPQDTEAIVSYLGELRTYLEPVASLVDTTKTMLEFTETSSTFSATALATMQATIAGLEKSVQAQRSLINTQVNAMNSFLATYQQGQNSLAQSIAIAEQQRDLLARNLQDSQTRASIGLEGANNSIDALQKNKQTTLASLQNSIALASVGYQEAQHQLSKMTIKAPIEGLVKEVFVDKGQEVAPGTPLIALSNNNHPEVRVTVTEEELPYISLGKLVYIRSADQVWEGSIVSYAKTTDSSLRYEVVITLDSSVPILGELVEVAIPFETTTPLLPLNSVTLINDGKGLITLLQGTGLVLQEVTVGKLWGIGIEIVSPLDPSRQIVTSDATAFDPSRFELVKQPETL